MEAITREEKIISGENLTPITRKEMFLAKAAGQDVKTPEPITREEMFLNRISGGGGSTNSGGAELNIAYGDTPPDDTTKLWIKCDTPEAVQVLPPSLVGANAVATVSSDGEITTLDMVVPETIDYMATSAVVGTKMYLFGGSQTTGNGDKIHVFDAKTSTITKLDTTLPTKIGGMASAVVGTKIYLFGGTDGTKRNYIYVFNTETSSITKSTMTLSTASAYMASAAVGTKVYLFGGSANSALNTIILYDLSTSTKTTLSATLPAYYYNIASAVVGTKIYLFGGTDGTNRRSDIHVFDTETNTRKKLNTLPNAAHNMASAVIGKKVYLFGGNQTDGNSNTILVFDTEANEITTLNTLPNASQYICAMAMDSKVYLIDKSSNRVAYVFDAPQESFSLAENHALVVASLDKNFFALLPNVVMGVERAYIGNANNESEPIEAALYQDGEWKTI